MAGTILLDRTTWDCVLDAKGNIAVASEPYSLAQDAASAIKTFLGEVYLDTTLGIPYLEKILGQRPSIAYLKDQFKAAAESVPGVGSAQVFLTALTDRALSGQVQVVAAATGQRSVATFEVVNPQGTG